MVAAVVGDYGDYSGHVRHGFVTRGTRRRRTVNDLHLGVVWQSEQQSATSATFFVPRLEPDPVCLCMLHSTGVNDTSDGA